MSICNQANEGLEDEGEAVVVKQRNRQDQDGQPPRDYRPGEVDAEPKPLGQEAPEVVDDAAKISARRLHGGLDGTAIRAFIGGMSIGFGVVSTPSTARLVGALAFLIGFLILLIGKSELFTETFFCPLLVS